ncbi:hypothetical protein [Pseudogemmobacter bohemicus]|uniref:hypothetical protein n=1 Tax=Pseudogemmobacter bohemicus TaxID=2250708 RepID=UPI000DD3966E|nr:hypothetical protein [Pseudogemmobacter bohemicus]
MIGTLRPGGGNDGIIGNIARSGGGAVAPLFRMRWISVLRQGRIWRRMAFGNGGAAPGDICSGFGIINGSNTGNDRRRGGAEVHSFPGSGGKDAPNGGAGNDAPGGHGGQGDTGTDRLNGWFLFRFFLCKECGDVIVDFSPNAPGE